MPWRFLFFIFALLLGCLFALFNADKVNINFGFFHLESVYLSAALLISFVLGAVSILPFALMRSFKKKDKKPKINAGSPVTDVQETEKAAKSEEEKQPEA